MKRLLIFTAFLLVLFCAPHATHAQVCNGSHPLYAANTAAQADVQACLNLTHNCDDLIYIPPGAATWNGLTLSNPPTGCLLHHGIRIYGATVVTITGNGATASATGDTATTCNSNINACITLNSSNQSPNNDPPAVRISGCTPTSYCDVANISIFTTAINTNGQIDFTTQVGAGGAHFHNFHIMNSANGGEPLQMNGGPALIDTGLWDDTASSSNGNGVVVKGSVADQGYSSWQQPSNFGSSDAVFVENSRLNFSLGNGDGVCDVYAGGSIVMRYSWLNNFNGCGDHGYDSGAFRGALRKELYNNTLVCGSSALGNNRGGSYYDFNNTFVAGLSACGTHSLQYFRQSNLAPPEITKFGAAGTSCPGCNWTPLSAVLGSSGSVENTLNAPDFIAGHAYAANATVGPLTNNAQASNFLLTNGPRTSGTYPNFQATAPGSTLTDSNGGIWLNVGGSTAASPAPGIAAGFLSTNLDIPCSSGATCTAFVDGVRLRDQPGTIGNGQRAFPAYAFNETNAPANVFSSTDSVSQVNRDFFNPAASFNGTGGTGSGLLASRPATCTNGVAYYATDQGPQGTLYQCQSGSWVSYYQPFTHPHPEVTPPCLNRMFTNWSGGTAGQAPTGTTMNASTHGFNFGNWSSSATDMTYTSRSDMGLSLPTGTLCLDNTNYPGTESLVIERTGTGAVGVSSIAYTFNAHVNSPTTAAVCFMSDIVPNSGQQSVDIFYLAAGSTDTVNITFVNGNSLNIETKITGGTGNSIAYTPGTIVTLILQYNRVQNSQLMVLAGCGGNGALIGNTGPVGVMGGASNPDHITIGSQGANQSLLAGNHLWYSVPQVALDGAFPIQGVSGGGSLTISPGSIAFGNQNIGQPSGAQTITVTNNTGSTVTSSGSPSYSGANPADFSTGTNLCGGSVPNGSTCTFTVIFKPSIAGGESATVSIPFTGFAPLSVPLTGIGVQNSIPAPAQTMMSLIISPEASTTLLQ